MEDYQQLRFDFHRNAFSDQFGVDNIGSDTGGSSFSFLSRLTSINSDTSSRSFLSNQLSNHEFYCLNHIQGLGGVQPDPEKLNHIQNNLNVQNITAFQITFTWNFFSFSTDPTIRGYD